jgi:hypothetical protein
MDLPENCRGFGRSINSGRQLSAPHLEEIASWQIKRLRRASGVPWANLVAHPNDTETTCCNRGRSSPQRLRRPSTLRSIRPLAFDGEALAEVG